MAGPGPAGFRGEAGNVDAELAERAAPLLSVFELEQKRVIRVAMDPTIGAHFGLELLRSPAGIAEREEPLLRTFSGGDRTENVARGREADIAHGKGCLSAAIVAGV